MKFYATFLAIFICLTCHGQHKYSDHPSTHGMVIFGQHQVYASHLPMFHSPHDYQVILELKLDDESKKLFVKDQRENTNYQTYTIAPQNFILPEMLDNPKPFKAVLYRGHFERGGQAISDSIVIAIEKVIYRKKFQQKSDKKPMNNFILFGNVKEQFAIHEIIKAPDFDQIIQIEYQNTFKNQPYKTISVGNTMTPIGVSGNRVEIKNHKFILLKNLYLEFNDLKTTSH